MNPFELDPQTFAILAILTVIDLILRGFAMWLAAGHQQKGWFIVLLVFNTLGILPALYLILAQPKEDTED